MGGMTPPRGYTKEHTEKRIRWLAEKTGFHVRNGEPDDPAKLKGIIENHLGFVPIPLAVAGPLLIHGDYAEGQFYVPLCTLEGTLTISMTRGLYLTQLAGGIKTRHIKQELSRSPLFVFNDIDEVEPFQEWVDASFESIKAAAESTTRYGRLLRIDQYTVRNSVILDFIYNTGEAAGQNMVTLATYEACAYIRQNYTSGRPRNYYIECNFNCDKNPAYKSVLHGRSHQVIASALIPGRFLRRVLRTTAQEYCEAWSHCTRSGQIAGVVGNNLHVANALAAIYLATGQDVACVAENAVGNVEFEVRDQENLFVTLTMPSISVGTVGGGTTLSHQKSNLEMLGCSGKNSSKKLAEIVCASALALELSLGGAIVSDEFAQAHAMFGRR